MENLESITRMLVMPADLNSNGKLFGGQLLKWMDEQAYICATRNTGQHIVTVEVKRVKFLNPAENGDLLEMISKITKSHGASLELEINTFINSKNQTIPISTAVFTMAAVNENGRPVKINQR